MTHLGIFQILDLATLITNKTKKHSELRNIRSTLRLNGFPTRTSFLTFELEIAQ